MFGFNNHRKQSFEDRHFAPWGPACRHALLKVDEDTKSKVAALKKSQHTFSDPILPGAGTRARSIADTLRGEGAGSTRGGSHGSNFSCFGSIGVGTAGIKSFSTNKKALSTAVMEPWGRQKPQRNTYVINDPLGQRPSTFYAGRRAGNLPNMRLSKQSNFIQGMEQRTGRKRFSSFLHDKDGAQANDENSKTNRRASCGLIHEEEPEESAEHRPNDKLHCAMRAYDRDKEFYQEQLMKWRATVNETDLIEELNKHRQSQFFDFMQAERFLDVGSDDGESSGGQSLADSDASMAPHNGAGLELQEGAERFLPESFLHQDLSIAGEVPPQPSFSMAMNVELTGSQSLVVREMLARFVEASKPCAKLDNEHVFRPTWCRFVLDCFILRAPNENAGWPSYHYAVRHFDAVAHPWKGAADGVFQFFDANAETPADVIGPKVGSTLCVHIEQCLVLVGVLLGSVDDPVESTRFFFDSVIPQVQELRKCLTEDIEDRLKIDSPRDEEDQASEVEEDEAEREKKLERRRNEWLNQRKPTFYASVQGWYKGLAKWRKLIDHYSSPQEMRRHRKLRHTLEGFLTDMLVEPDVFHFVVMFEGLFKVLYTTYADVRELNKPDTQGNMVQYHLGFSTFFMFCLDFGLFPLCSYEEIKRIYLNAECHTELQPPETRPPSATDSEANLADRPPSAKHSKENSGRNSQLKASEPLGRKTRATIASPSGISVKSLTGKSSIASPSGQSGLSTTASTTIGTKSAPVNMRKTQSDRSKSKSKVAMEEAPRRPSVKQAIDTTWVKKDFKIMTAHEIKAYHALLAMHGYVRDRFQKTTNLFAQFKLVADGAVNEHEILQGLRHMNLQHSLGLQDIRQIMGAIEKDHDGQIDLSHLDKICANVSLDHLSRMSEEEREQRNLYSMEDSLFTKVNRHLTKPELNKPVHTITHAFTHASFIECILKIVMLHLNSSKCSVQSVAPTYLKCLWLVSFLHHKFHGHVQRYEESALIHKRPFSADVSRPNTSQESTRPATREMNRPHSSSSSSEPTSGQFNVADFGFNKGETMKSDFKGSLPEGCEVSYTSPLETLICDMPELFTEWPQRHKVTRYSACSLCARKPWNGWGHGMCHGCSQVDQGPHPSWFQNMPLYPIWVRRRILEKNKDVQLLGWPEPSEEKHSSEDGSASDCHSSAENEEDP